jgi:putative PEP-CTERM system histidine kinase
MAVVVLVNLEGTLKASAGINRWHVKPMLLGVGSLFAAYVYTMSQTLLFSAVTATLQSIDSCAVVVASILIIVSLTRDRLLQTQVSFSQAALYNSLVASLIGIYLLAVGLLAKAIQHLGGNEFLPLGTFVVFMALVGLTLILLSDRLRQTVKQFISRHVYHVRYDYRYMWMAFSQRTTSVVDVQELCAVVAKMVSETFGVPAVTIWLRQEETEGEVRFGGSTVFSEGQLPLPGFTAQGRVALLDYMRARPFPIDFEAPPDKLGATLYQAERDGFHHAYIRYCVSLTAAQESLGIMTLHDRLTHEAFALQDHELLQTIADQVAASLLNLQFGQRLARAKQMEAFQTLSAFFVHDLKNLASKLSMTVTNLPAHYDNPAFREDTLRLLADSVTKINAMCSRLSQLTHQLELQLTQIDLNALIHAVLADLRPSLTVRLVEDLQPMPWLNVDPEQLQKVIVNLVLNAHEAVEANEVIRIATEWTNGWAVLAVSDNGCGMSKEFLERSLFQPFRTTKKRGLGIGLFQSKIIIEAHQGKIEVESEEGKGSTFRVFLKCET